MKNVFLNSERGKQTTVSVEVERIWMCPLLRPGKPGKLQNEDWNVGSSHCGLIRSYPVKQLRYLVRATFSMDQSTRCLPFIEVNLQYVAWGTKFFVRREPIGQFVSRMNSRILESCRPLCILSRQPQTSTTSHQFCRQS